MFMRLRWALCCSLALFPVGCRCDGNTHPPPRSVSVTRSESEQSRTRSRPRVTLRIAGDSTMDLLLVRVAGVPETTRGVNRDRGVVPRSGLPQFYLGQSEVTWRQWLAVMRESDADQEVSDLPVSERSWRECQEFL